MYWHDVLVGGRTNRSYNDTGAAPVFRKLWHEVGGIRDQEAIKSDIFGTQNPNRTGNWAMLYGVGRRSMMNVGASGGATGWAGAQTFNLEFPGPGSYNPSGCSENSGSGVLCSTNAINGGPSYFVNYVNRNAYDGGTAGTGNGDYRLKSNSPAINFIPSGGAVLPYDLAGQIRNNSGWGSAGSYEQAIVMTQVFGW
jgi:hypothetical protein